MAESADLRHCYDKFKRIPAYAMSGEQVCAPGVGEGLAFGTYPAHWTCLNVLETGSRDGWITILCTPASGETPIEGVHWKRNGFKFNGVALAPSNVTAVAGDTLGSFQTSHVTLLETVGEQQFENIPCHEVGDISTPPTPPPGSSQHEWHGR